MSKLSSLLEEFAELVSDYRSGELDKPNPRHVEQWAKQFPIWSKEEEDKIFFLETLIYAFQQTYFKHDRVLNFLETRRDRLSLKKAYLLNIQQQGESQKHLLELLERNLRINRPGGYRGETLLIYLDDFIFTGDRFLRDIENWLKANKELLPPLIEIEAIALAAHTYAEYTLTKQIKSIQEELNVRINFHADTMLENRRSHRNQSDVLWPTSLPDYDKLKEYIATLPSKYPFKPRETTEYVSKIFKSEEGRKLLEEQFTLTGAYIWSLSESPARSLRPLGYSPFGLGFGSLLVSYRNCPNTTPLALWWGNPNIEIDSPLSKWYPLFPRKTCDG